MRWVSRAVGMVVAVAVLAAQGTPRRSGIDLNNIDPAVRAQDDFYRHVNGKWLARTEIPADKPSYGAFVELSDKAEADLRTIVEAAASTGAPRGSVTQQVGDL